MAQYVDILTGEKLPNGDVSSLMAQMNKELSSIKEKGTTDGLTIRDKAHFLVVAKNLTDAIEYYTKLWSGELVKNVVTGNGFEFSDLGVSVTVKNGGNTTKIDSSVFDELTIDEIKKAATITEKSLKELGKEELIKKHKMITGQKANSVMYKTLV